MKKPTLEKLYLYTFLIIVAIVFIIAGFKTNPGATGGFLLCVIIALAIKRLFILNQKEDES